MAIGNWGPDFIFVVSDNLVFTPRDVSRTVSSEWAVHNRVGQKSQVEFLRPSLQKFTFNIELNAELGVKPRATIDKMADCAEQGTINPLVFGGRRIGRHNWRITSISEAWETVFNQGELVRAKLSVTMEEYV